MTMYEFLLNKRATNCDAATIAGQQTSGYFKITEIKD
jgi:hypothetical protein